MQQFVSQHSLIALDYKIMVELELRQYAPVLPFAGLKSYRHYFLADCHTDMENQQNYCVQTCFLGAKYAKNAFVPAAGAYGIPTVGFYGAYF